MGLRLGILVASVAANVVLAVLVFRPHSSPPSHGDNIEQPAPRNAEPTRLVARPRAKESANEAPDPLAFPGDATFSWSRLESQDYKEYIARLRAFGVPERILRDIIIADVNKLYQPRLAALRPPPATRTNFGNSRSVSIQRASPGNNASSCARSRKSRPT